MLHCESSPFWRVFRLGRQFSCHKPEASEGGGYGFQQDRNSKVSLGIKKGEKGAQCQYLLSTAHISALSDVRYSYKEHIPAMPSLVGERSQNTTPDAGSSLSRVNTKVVPWSFHRLQALLRCFICPSLISCLKSFFH